MAKKALIIGVSEYELGLAPLPGAAKDIEAIQRVLQHPEMGGFDDVKMLANPEPQVMREAIEILFSGRAKEDLLLLFFSGHGIKDENGKLHLATRTTRKNEQGQLVRATSVPASFVHESMSNSRSKRQVVILDCCFSGAFAEGWSAKDDGSVDIKNQLGGEGRAVLTSSTSTQYSFEQEGSDLSIYTRYLIEGIETGAADIDSDGVVSIDELHEYAKGKVQEAAPAMKPEIYAIKEGYKIHLSQAPIEDPKLRYRKEIEQCASQGEISPVSRYTLDALRETLELPFEEAAVIENEVLEPYRKYQKKLQRYEQVLTEALQREHPLSNNTISELKRLQRVLSLRDEDIDQFGVHVPPQQKIIPDSNQSAAVSQPQFLFHLGNTAPVDASSNAGATVLAKTSKQPSSKLKTVSALSVAVLRNHKLLLGGGFTAFILAALFLAKMPPPKQNIESASAANSSVPTVAMASAQDYYNQGEVKYSKQEYQGAIEDYTQAIKLSPDYAEAYYGRGVTQHFLENYQEAISDYNQALTIKPDYARAYYSRGNAKSLSSNFQGAIADYDQALKLDPNYADAYYYRGNSKSNLKDYQGAIVDYDQALKLNASYVDAYFFRGTAKHFLKDYQGAIADYDQALKLSPNHANAYYNRGNAKSLLGNFQDAIADYNQALKLDPDLADAYYYRGNSKSNLKDSQGALADYQKAAELYQKEDKTREYQNVLLLIQKLQ